jgi:hypothetical protein
VTAAVLLYRAVTYLPPIPLGAIACLTMAARTGADPQQPAKRWPAEGPGNAA